MNFLPDDGASSEWRAVFHSVDNHGDSDADESDIADRRSDARALRRDPEYIGQWNFAVGAIIKDAGNVVLPEMPEAGGIVRELEERMIGEFQSEDPLRFCDSGSLINRHRSVRVTPREQERGERQSKAPSPGTSGP